MTTAVSKDQKVNFGDKLMKWVIIDPQVIEKGNRKIIKLFGEKYLLGKVLNKIVFLLSLVIDLETLLMVLIRLRKSLAISNEPYFKQTIDAFKCKVTNKGLDLSKVKKEGPAIFYANHPLAGLDVFAVLSEIEKVRPDVKVVAATFLENFPGLEGKSFIVNNQLYDGAKDYNKDKIQQINDYIKNGGALLIFPSGKLSRWEGSKFHAVDAEWKKGFIKIGENHEDTDYYPVFVEGEPSKTYLRLQSISRHLANPYVFKELSNRVGTDAVLHFGPAIKLASIQDRSYPDQIAFLRQRLYGLGHEYFNALKRKSDNTAVATQLLGQRS